MSVCSETPRAMSKLEQFETRLGTLGLIVRAPSSETVEHVCRHLDLHGSNVSLNGCARASEISVKSRPRKALGCYSDCTELLLGLLRTPSHAEVGATSTPTCHAAAGEGL